MPKPNVTEWIRKRRSVYPKDYRAPVIQNAHLEEILENARWAPTHKMTQPWRFVVVTQDARARLSEALTQGYQSEQPDAVDAQRKIERIHDKCMSSGAIILIGMERDEQQRVPEWEEIAAVACAVQNMMLTCSALDIGCYWSSPSFGSGLHSFHPLLKNCRQMGMLYLGYTNAENKAPNRKPCSEFSTIVDV